MSNPQEDADRIRLKRLAKLQSAAASTSTTPEPSAAAPPPPPPKITPKPSPPPPAKRPAAQPAAPPSLAPAKRTPAPQKLDLPAWENDTIRDVLKVTLDKGAAERTGHELIWLKPLAEELASEEPELPQPRRLDAEILDRVLIARLELDPQAMSDDLEFLPVLASLPPQTIFEYLVGCWKRINSARSALMKKNYPPSEVQQALGVLDKLRDLVISYAGLTLQEPDMFPQPSGRDLGPAELVAPLLSLTSLSAPLLSSSYPDASLSPSDVEPFLHDLVRRFEPDGELDGVLGPVVERLLFHEALFRPGGIGGGDASWRGVLGGLEALVAIKPVAVMITRMERWNPPGASASTFEKESLMGPLLRLGVFEREWPAIARSYYSEPEKRTRPDVESSFASLRGTLKTLQSTLFQVFNTIVRASPEAREAVLQYFARIVSLNVKRAGMQVEPDTVASDSFMVNVQTILFRFAEPFMDAHYSKIDRIDPLYYAHSSRIDLTEETRINATSDEANQWAEQNRADGTPPPNFISDIFYLALAMNHYGYQRTIQWYDDLAKHIDDLQRHLDMLQGDTSWQGTPFQARAEAAITNVKNEMSKIHMQQLAYETQLADPELVFRSIGFVTFVSVWMIRFVDPKKKHPNPAVELPLPKEVPLSFRVLPEYLLEDIVDYYLYTVRHTPQSLDISGKNELVIFCLTFLTSTWYIKNPFLKAKINEVLFYGTLPFRGERTGVLGGTLNSHPVALKHLMSALMHFYIEVEQTGASSQFYDKFNARRNIAYILKAVWDNPIHRDALRNETNNVEKFVRFVNLMINDVTYLMDESLSELTQIHNIQVEMEDPSWQTKPLQTRREREATLRQLERHAIGYTTLGRSTVDMLRLFTAETKGPFMMPEIVGRLAAMLDYNLDVLVNRAADLQVKDKEKYKFNPRQLFSDILQVYLNLSDQGDFARAVAEDGRSYKKELFEKAMYIARHRSLKTPDEVEKLRMFVVKVEETKATIEAEEDLGDIPDEFLDPLMFTLMRDPVILPSSRTVIDRSTIKAHLLSDSKDPFNRQPLSIEDVVPDTALKARIDAFLAERKRKGTALDIPPEDIVNMNNETADAQMEGT